MRAFRVFLALSVFVAALAWATDLVRDGNTTSYTLPVGGMDTAGKRLPIPLTFDRRSMSSGPNWGESWVMRLDAGASRARTRPKTPAGL